MDELRRLLSRLGDINDQINALVMFLLLFFTKDDSWLKLLQDTIFATKMVLHPEAIPPSDKSSPPEAIPPFETSSYPEETKHRSSNRLVLADSESNPCSSPEETKPSSSNRLVLADSESSLSSESSEQSTLSSYFEGLQAYAYQFIMDIYGAYYNKSGPLNFFESFIVHIYTREPTICENPFYGINFYKALRDIASATKCPFIRGEPMENLCPVDSLYYCLFVLALEKIPNSPVMTLYRAVNFNANFTKKMLDDKIRNKTLVGTFISTTNIVATLSDFLKGDSAIIIFNGACAKDLSPYSQYPNESEYLILSAMRDYLSLMSSMDSSLYQGSLYQVTMGNISSEDDSCNNKIADISKPAANIIFGAFCKSYDEQLEQLDSQYKISESKNGYIHEDKSITYRSDPRKDPSVIFLEKNTLSKKAGRYPPNANFVNNYAHAFNVVIEDTIGDSLTKRLSLSLKAGSPTILVDGAIYIVSVFAVSVTLSRENAEHSKEIKLVVTLHLSNGAIVVDEFTAIMDAGVQTRLFVMGVQRTTGHGKYAHAIEIKAIPVDDKISMLDINASIGGVFFKVHSHDAYKLLL